MGRGNDAIPTWSGFNYQGKMMLLYVLELINQIAKDKNKDIDVDCQVKLTHFYV